MPLQIPTAKDFKELTDLRSLLAFGSGVGIEIGAENLEVIAARVRPSKIEVAGRLVIGNYAARPAAEWGAEYARFLKSHGMGYLSATVLLPRREVIVRQIPLPGVAGKDLENAVRFQMDTLHPYGDEDVAWGYSRLEFGSVLVGIVRRQVVDRYRTLFSEAGILVNSFTFSAAAVHSAIRLNGGGHAGGFVAIGRTATGGVEVYGESPARPVFSAEFNMTPQRAAVLALAELRLPPDTQALTLEQVLPKPAVNPVENDLSRNALPYATALAGACPLLAPSANVLPPEHRRSSSRVILIPTLVLGGLLLALVGAMFGWSRYADSKYLAGLNAEIARVEPVAARAMALDRQIGKARAQTQQLDRFRAQTRLDLDALNELTRIIEPPAWTSVIDLSREMARITGEARDASPLVKLLDSSPFFENSVPDFINRANNGGAGETFQIHASRENGK
jgi:Tfp pilus assembly protein PilN